MSDSADKQLEKLDQAIKALSPTAKDVLTGEYGRQKHADVKHWVRAGREADGGIRLIGQAEGLDEVGGEIRRGARLRETELPEPTEEDVARLFANAMERGDRRLLGMLESRSPNVRALGVAVGLEKEAKRKRRAKK